MRLFIHRTELQYLDDIFEAIQNIEEDTKDIPYNEFYADRRRKDAVIRNFEINYWCYAPR